MVGIDALSQQVAAVKQLSRHHEIPVCAIHAPCLLLTQRVWGTDPWDKLQRSAEMARSEEHTSELQSLMRISYAVFCLKKKNKHNTMKPYYRHTDMHRIKRTKKEATKNAK